MSGKVLTAGQNTVILETGDDRKAHRADQPGGFSKGPISDHGTGHVCVNIQHRCEIEINPYRFEFVCHDFTNGVG